MVDPLSLDVSSFSSHVPLSHSQYNIHENTVNFNHVRINHRKTIKRNARYLHCALRCALRVACALLNRITKE